MNLTKGRDELVLYLDFDGVLHHERVLWHPERGPHLSAPARYTLFQHANLLAELLTPYPSIRIVLSTFWVVRYGLDTTVKRLPTALQARVIGATYHSRHMPKGDFAEMPRGQQVFEDVLRRRPRKWLALDDDNEGWPTEQLEHFLQTDFYEGISDPSVLSELKRRLEKLCKQ